MGYNHIMESTASYPNNDIERAAQAGAGMLPRARIAAVAPGSPADDAGFEAGCFVTAVDGQPVRDIIDWRWLASEDVMSVSYIDLDGDEGEVELEREWGEDWGFEFEGLVFDSVRQCRNACTFCFMHQLPRGMRPSLSLRDDDFRLSFLVGTFVTLTNITPDDETRIIGQHLSPLRVSLQVSDGDVRRRMIGKHAAHGLEVLDRLLEAGIEFHAQVVLVPGANDGDVLVRTLEWAYARPGILNVGIVPLGYTCHQSRFDHSFNEPADARAVLDLIAPFQQRAERERGSAWVFAADEFYSNAWGDALLDHLPPTEHYGDFSLFEDGIGIIRSTVDDWQEAELDGTIARAADALREQGVVARMVAGYAQKEFLTPLVDRSGIADVFQPLYVANDFFGGNVDVTGLLVGRDMANAIKQAAGTAVVSPGESPHVSARLASACLYEDSGKVPAESLAGTCVLSGERRDGLYLIPKVVFNDDGVTLDDMTLEDMEKAAGQKLHMVSCSPKEYFEEIAALPKRECGWPRKG